MVRERCEPGMHLAQRSAVADGVVLPAEHAGDVVTCFNAVELTVDDFAYHARLQYFPDLERRHVRLHVVHPPAHVRVDRHEYVSNEHLAVARLRNRFFGYLEILGGDPASRPACETNLRVAH